MYASFSCGVLFHTYAYALSCTGFDGVAHMKSLDELLILWPEDKNVKLIDDFDALQNLDLVQW